MQTFDGLYGGMSRSVLYALRGAASLVHDALTRGQFGFKSRSQSLVRPVGELDDRTALGHGLRTVSNRLDVLAQCYPHLHRAVDVPA